MHNTRLDAEGREESAVSPKKRKKKTTDIEGKSHLHHLKMAWFG
jgi:hypothetical protein